MSKKITAKRPPKTPKEKAWLKKLAETGDHIKSAQEVYDVSSYASARAIGNENLHKLTIGDALEKHGVTDDYVASKIKGGMEATKIISATIVAGDPKEAGSETKDFIEVPDWLVQHKFTETALRLKGYGQQFQFYQSNVDNRQVFVMLPPEVQSAINK